MVLWNDGVMNQLTALSIPPPYDGSGITSVSLDASHTMFALGDICTEDDVVVVPYINEFNVKFARFSENAWGTFSIPLTFMDNYDSADCGNTEDGIFISAHNDSDDTIEIFQTINGGDTWMNYGQFDAGPMDSISGPFDGAVRDQLVTAANGDAASLYQLDDGTVRVSIFDTQDSPPVVSHADVLNMPAPMGFTVVRESSGDIVDASGRAVVFTLNADNQARTVNVPINNPAGATTGNLGGIDNTGSLFQFQSGVLIPELNEMGLTMRVHMAWDHFYTVEDPFPSGTVATDSDFPSQGQGGPVDACLQRFGSNLQNARLRIVTAGDKNDTVLLGRSGETPYSDGFEANALHAWDCSNP